MEQTARRSQLRSKRTGRMEVSAVVLGAVLVGAGAPIMTVPSTAFAKETREMLVAFADEHVLSAAELDKQRGGFFLPNGAMVNFGVEVQQFIDNTLQNALSVSGIQNNFTVTQTTPSGTTTENISQLPSNGFSVTTVGNNGETKLVTNITNGAIQNLVQNGASNHSIQTVTTINVSTQGFQKALQTVTTNFQIMNTIRMNNWTHR
ncbi:MAG: hypothetical protein ACREED_05260 [Stellaceae bacterium]